MTLNEQKKQELLDKLNELEKEQILELNPYQLYSKMYKNGKEEFKLKNDEYLNYLDIIFYIDRYKSKIFFQEKL